MRTHLLRLSNADFRRTETYLRNEVFPVLTNAHALRTYYQLLRLKRQAFLTCAIPISRLKDYDAKAAEMQPIYQFLRDTHPASILSVINMIIPHLKTAEQIDELFEAFHIDTPRERIPALLKSPSPISFYSLFQALRQTDDPSLLHKCALFLLNNRKHEGYNEEATINFVSILRAYFSMPYTLPVPHPLAIDPYELSRLESSLPAFLQAIEGKRPSLPPHL